MSEESAPKLEEVKELVVQLRHHKEAAAAAEAAVEETQSKLIDIMQKHNMTKIVGAIDGADTVTATLVEVSRVVIDPQKLKKGLGASLWNKVTKRVPDKGLIEAGIAAGEVDPNIVAAASEEVPNRPHIRISARRAPSFGKVTKYRRKKVKRED